MRGLVCIVIATALLSFALPGSTASFHEPAQYPYSVAWRAPANHTGDIVLRYTVDFGPDNRCFQMQEFASGGGDGSLMFMATSDAGGVTAGWGSQTVHAHIGDVDTHTLASDGGGFGLRVSWTAPASGTSTVTLSVFGGTSFSFADGPWGPLAFEIACEQPITLGDYAGSTEAFGFTQQDFAGTSVAANAIFYGASTNIDGHVGASFSTETVALAALHSGTIDGALTASGPDGDTAFDLTTTPQWRAFGTSGPGGDWDLALDRTGGPQSDHLFGFLGGFDAVAEPDAIF